MKIIKNLRSNYTRLSGQNVGIMIHQTTGRFRVVAGDDGYENVIAPNNQLPIK